MAMVSGMSQGRGALYGNDYVDNRLDFRDDEICSCLPKMKQAKTRMTRAQLLKERIRQFSIWYFENEDQRENEHVKLRRERQQKVDDIQSQSWMRWLKMLYIFDGLVWITGGIFTLCSTVEVVGKNTPFHINKEQYRIIGPVVLLFGVILLLLATGIKHKCLKGLKTRKQTNFFIVQNRDSKRSSTKSRTNESAILLDTGYVVDAEECAEDCVKI